MNQFRREEILDRLRIRPGRQNAEQDQGDESQGRNQLTVAQAHTDHTL